MIAVTRLRGGVMFVNAELIELVEGVPDTTITLHNGHRYIVSDSVDQVIERILAYRRVVAVPTDSQDR